jgi:hypothetical protein
MVSMTSDYEALRRALEAPEETGSPDGTLGQLVSVRLTVEPRMLESVLEALARADFPINPQLTHQRQTLIEFPAYRGQLKQLDHLLRGLTVQVTARRMLDEIRATPDGERAPILAN